MMKEDQHGKLSNALVVIGIAGHSSKQTFSAYSHIPIFPYSRIHIFPYSRIHIFTYSRIHVPFMI